MWPFKRKKVNQESGTAGYPAGTGEGRGPVCPHCRSTRTAVVTHHGTDQAGYVKTWRGQRYLTCRCRECGQDFYAEEQAGLEDEALTGDRLIDDEAALDAAEDELRREAEDEDDRMCR